jgi:hypothetical protein
MQHASVYGTGLMFATGRCELVIMISLSVRFADEGQLGYEN